jgi:hypothetical protein
MSRSCRGQPGDPGVTLGVKLGEPAAICAGSVLSHILTRPLHMLLPPRDELLLQRDFGQRVDFAYDRGLSPSRRTRAETRTRVYQSKKLL